MDKQLKQRLLGAAVMLALAVIIVPELVKQPTHPAAQITPATIPPRPTVTIEQPTMTLRLNHHADETVGSIESASPAVSAGSTQTDATADVAQTVASIEVNTKPKVEILSADEAIASQAVPPAAPITQRQPPARLDERAPVNNGSNSGQIAAVIPPIAQDTTTRVPEPAVVLPKIEFVSLQQRRSATAPTPAAAPAQTRRTSANSWIVQAGSFAVARNAKLLREKLQARQFPASLAPAEVDGRTLYRVQIGPFDSRSESEQAKVRLLQEARVNGAVRRVN